MNKKLNHLDEQIKQQFGEEFLIKENTLGELIQFQKHISDILGTPQLPILFDNIEQDSILDLKEECIIINKQLFDNTIESAKCVAHEHRHIYQMGFIKQFPKDERSPRFLKNFKQSFTITDYSDYNQLIKYNTREIEIDAYAFTQIIIKEYYNIETKHPVERIQKIIDKYILTYYK